MSFTLWLILGLIFSILNSAFKKLNIPLATVGIVTGILFGPFYLDWIIFGEWEARISEIIVLLILFSAGFEIRWTNFLSAIKPGILVGLTGIFLSGVLGFVAGYSLTSKVEEALYIAIALTATSIGLIVPLLAREGILSSRVGQILLAAAIVDDIIALYLLSAAHLGLMSGNGINQLVFSLLSSLLFLSLICLILWVFQWLLFKIQITNNQFVRLPLLFLLAFLSAWFTHLSGLSPAVGGFAAGTILSLAKNNHQETDRILFNRVTKTLIPLFFLSIGMRITELDLTDLKLALMIIIFVFVAIIGKLLSPWVLFQTLHKNECWLLGMALVPRAEVALIVASIGLQQGHLSHHSMIALVFMTLITALLSSSTIPILARRFNSPPTTQNNF